jgi:hypothetical protein
MTTVIPINSTRNIPPTPRLVGKRRRTEGPGEEDPEGPEKEEEGSEEEEEKASAKCPPPPLLLANKSPVVITLDYCTGGYDLFIDLTTVHWHCSGTQYYALFLTSCLST